jgi:mRNA-degrading endonuclease toxin of MazEF toxin-antitoxin module
MIENILKLLDKWNIKKKNISTKEKLIFVKERDIVFINMGQNVGFEQDGKGDEFLRPVIVYKKFNNNLFLGIPLTSSVKDSKFYYRFEFKSKTDGIRQSSAILSQIKAIDTKRVKFKLGVINKTDFYKLYLKLLNTTKPSEIVTPRKSEESPEGICENIISKNGGDVK